MPGRQTRRVTSGSGWHRFPGAAHARLDTLGSAVNRRELPLPFVGMDVDRYWQRLRGLRSSPPGFAARNRERRDVFNTALEQAEQLARRADVLGPQTRPINLFYGLSQGTRAIAAALEPDDNSYWLTNHGVDHVGSLDRSLCSIQVQETDRPGGAFTKLASLLNSPGLPDPVQLGDLLAALPLHLPPSSWSDRPRSIGVRHLNQSSAAVLVNSPSVFAATGNWPVLADAQNGSLEDSRAVLARYVDEHYPSLRGMQPRPDGYAQLYVGQEGMQFNLKSELADHVGSDAARAKTLDDRTFRVAEGRQALPRFGSASEPCHPTVVCWAVLWTLSMLARYAPVRWAKALDVSKSPDAVALEEVLQDSMMLVPWCLVDALDAVPDWSGA